MKMKTKELCYIYGPLGVGLVSVGFWVLVWMFAQ
jgi:hypothetical protein